MNANMFYANPEMAWALKAHVDGGVDIGNAPLYPAIGGYGYNVGQAPGAPASKQISAAMPVHRGFGNQPGLHPVVPSYPSKMRGTALGFDSGAVDIAAAAQQAISRTPQRAMRPERLTVASNIAASFNLNSLLIQNNNQWASADALPADAFVADAVGTDMVFDDIPFGLDVILTVTNISGAGARFRATLLGTSLQ